MKSTQLWQQPNVLLSVLEGKRLPEPMSPDRADPSRSTWIASACHAILGSYRRDDFADPESYIVQLGRVLERFSDDIIKHATDPSTGIVRHCKWPPSIAEVVEFCEAEVKRRERFQQYAAMGTSSGPRPRGAKIPPGESYEEMFAKHGRSIGPFEPGRQLKYGR